MEKSGKQPAKLTLRQYICICTHLRTTDKMNVVWVVFTAPADF